MKGEKCVTMYDYILEEEGVLKRIIASQEQTTKAFVKLFLEKQPMEIVICGSGTSCHAAIAVRQFWEKLLHIRVRAEYAMVFSEVQEIYDEKMLLIGISQGGQSRSTVEALKKGRERGIATVGISENRQAELFRYSSLQMLMDCGEEKSVAKTKGYIATVGLLFAMAVEAAFQAGRITDRERENYRERMRKTAENFPQIIEKTGIWLAENREELLRARRLIVVGSGKQCATIREGTLKMLETMRYGISGYDLDEFCHGVYNSVDQDTYLLYLAAEGEDREAIFHLREVLSQTTSHQFLITGEQAGIKTGKKDCVLPFLEDECFSALEYIIPMQIMASTLPYDLGIDPFASRDPLFHKKMGSKLP